MWKLAKFIHGHPLVVSNRLSGFRRFLIWQIKSRLWGKEYVHSWIRGSKFYVKNGETGLTGNIYTGLHEFSDMGFLLHVLKNEDLFIDVGANSGSYTVLAGAAIGAKTISVEPVPATFIRLVRNIELNKVQERCQALNIGLASTPGFLNVTVDSDTTNHLVLGAGNEKTIQVEVRTLDQITFGTNPVLLKIDVEGWEMPVLAGGQETLNNHSLLAVILELNGSGEKFGYTDSEILKFLNSYSFFEYCYQPLKRKLLRINGKNLKSGNTIFVRDVDEILRRIEVAPKNNILGVYF